MPVPAVYLPADKVFKFGTPRFEMDASKPTKKQPRLRATLTVGSVAALDKDALKRQLKAYLGTGVRRESDVSVSVLADEDDSGRRLSEVLSKLLGDSRARRRTQRARTGQPRRSRMSFPPLGNLLRLRVRVL